jgi:LPXTG-site transpeptidase (sortase) family protein
MDMRHMRRASFVAFGLLAVCAVAASWLWLARPFEASAADTAGAAPGLATQLRHVGRDGATGMATWVGEGFIAEREREVERYGKDERDAVPPPTADGPTISRLSIDELGVSAAVARYGLDRFGRLDVPQDRVTVGWHPAYSTMPGGGGATFLAAHYEYGGTPGIFHDLSSLEPGETFFLATDSGEVHEYRVTSAIDYELGDIDMGALLRGREGMESVTLMTCSGRFVDGTYDYRTVVLAERVLSAG